MRRRDFLGGLVSATASISAKGRSSRPSEASKSLRIACNSWPFRGYFDTPSMHQYRDAMLPLLTQAQFPEFLADQFQIYNVEFLPQHFLDTDPGTLEKVKAGLKKANARCCNLMGVEFAGGVFKTDADGQAIAKEAERWVSVAVALGSPSITIALTGEGPADAHAAATNLKRAVDIAYRRRVKVLFHNDDLKHESAATLTTVIEQLRRDRTGTCPDFGNFATKSAAFALDQLLLLAPYASNICHSKDGIAENGKFYPDDFPASMKVMQAAGFPGIYSLEFEGSGDPIPGVRNLMSLTEEYLKA